MASVDVLNYRVEGAGSPLLLIHGFGVSFNIWRSLTPLLRDRFRLVIIELPAIGSSPQPVGDSYTAACVAAIESVRQKLAIPKWSVLGYSIGVGVAAAYAAAHPDSVSDLVFLCPPLLKGFRWWGLRVLHWLDIRWPAFGDWVLSGWRIFGLVALIGFNARPNRLTHEWVGEITSQPPPVLKTALREFPPVSQLLVDTGHRRLLLCGKNDLASTRPPSWGMNVAFFAGDHSGPMVVAQPIAAQIIRFLTEKSGR